MLASAELLAPAGDISKLHTVLRYGADAVYLGGKAFNLRAASQNFSQDQLREAVNYAHRLGKRVYVTLNIIAHNRDLKGLPAFIQYLDSVGVDGVIVADIGVMGLVREHSSLPIHVSTQASTASWKTAQMYQQLGAKRVVLARELSLDEIKAIKDKVPDLELEVFVHGAMCMTYSGRCNLSSYLSQRDSNHGMCSNSCRWKYALVEEKRPGQYFPVYEDESGSFIYNSKDLCTVEFLDQIVDAGVSGLKIEGRGRSLLYGATTVRVYREALDLYQSGQWEVRKAWREELETYHHRGYTTGFFFGKLDRHAHNLEGVENKKALFAGQVLDQGYRHGIYEVLVRNPLHLGTELEALQAGGPILRARLTRIRSLDGTTVHTMARPGQTLELELDMPLQAGDILRLRTDQPELEENEESEDEQIAPVSTAHIH
jgi:U32 family peptidase